MKVINLKNHRKGVVRCDRVTPLGNPFELKDKDDAAERNQVILGFRRYLFRVVWRNEDPSAAAKQVAAEIGVEVSKKFKHPTRKAFLQQFTSLGDDSILGCWCAPLYCHCDVIISAKDAFDRLQEGHGLS
jgi:hypothetical protein